MTTFSRAYLSDLGKRVGWTFVQAGASVIVVTVTEGHPLDRNVAAKAGIAGGAAVLSLIKGLVAHGFGDPDTADFGKTVTPPPPEPVVPFPDLATHPETGGFTAVKASEPR